MWNPKSKTNDTQNRNCHITEKKQVAAGVGGDGQMNEQVREIKRHKLTKQVSHGDEIYTVKKEVLTEIIKHVQIQNRYICYF